MLRGRCVTLRTKKIPHETETGSRLYLYLSQLVQSECVLIVYRSYATLGGVWCTDATGSVSDHRSKGTLREARYQALA